MKTSQQNKDNVTEVSANTNNQRSTQLFSFKDNRPEAKMHNEIQRKSNSYAASLPSFQNNTAAVISRKENKTGMPDNLKSGIESLSGIDASDVRVHYNSNKPAQMNAHAYAQGTNIHIASGQEKHLAHEAWHTVQQKQGRVQPTTSVNGAAVNDNAGLEKEADVMGAKALQMKSNESQNFEAIEHHTQSILQKKKVIQLAPKWPESIDLNGVTYVRITKPSGYYYQTADFSRANGCYISIHEPTENLTNWQGNFWTKCHASRKKVCQITWPELKEGNVSYTAGETELVENKETYYDTARQLGLAFISKFNKSWLK